MPKGLMEEWIESLQNERGGADVTVRGFKQTPRILTLAVRGEDVLLTLDEWRALVDGVERRLKEQEGG